MSAEPQTADSPTPEKQQLGPPLEKHKLWLVTEGNRIGQLASVYSEWKSQIRVLQEAAQEETEPRVLLNLLRYQAARNEKKWWTKRDVVSPLFDLMKECITRAGDDGLFAVELIQHLLLYTVRAYTYENSSLSSNNGNANESKGGGS